MMCECQARMDGRAWDRDRGTRCPSHIQERCRTECSIRLELERCTDQGLGMGVYERDLLSGVVPFVLDPLPCLLRHVAQVAQGTGPCSVAQGNWQQQELCGLKRGMVAIPVKPGARALCAELRDGHLAWLLVEGEGESEKRLGDVAQSRAPEAEVET